ncbi:hypothetical protein V6N13_023423 [Hibiscus sabdariffa]
MFLLVTNQPILELLCLQTVMAMINLEIGASGVVSQECKAVILELLCLQTVMAMINLEIGASGVVSQECKAVILELLCLQTVMAMINLEIGASGVVSQECKAVLCDRMPSPMGESAVDYKSLSSMPKVSFDKVLELALEEVVEVLKFSASAALLLWIR